MRRVELMIFEKGNEYCWFDEFVQWIIIGENKLEYMDMNGNNHFIEGINEMEVRIS